MKANELTGGIYVYFNCFDGSKIIVKVTGFKDGVVYGVSKTSSHWCTIEKVEPIPLTAEILGKNGFTLEHYSGDVMTGYWWTRNDFVIHNSMNDAIGRNNFKYEYVHQLQHALRLCGIDKEIIL